MDAKVGMDTQMAVATKAKIAQSHLSKVLRCEASATLDLISAIAHAFGVQPWELLTDDDMTRKAALERMLFGPATNDPGRELPRKEVALRRRKKGGRNEGDPLQ